MGTAGVETVHKFAGIHCNFTCNAYFTAKTGAPAWWFINFAVCRNTSEGANGAVSYNDLVREWRAVDFHILGLL